MSTATLDQLGLALAAVPAPGSPFYGASGHQIALGDVARAIRAQVPIAGERAVDAECQARRDLVQSALEHIGVVPGPRRWWTLVCEQRPDEPMPKFSGIWADSYEEAMIEILLWRPDLDDRHIFSCAPDDEGKHQHELEAQRRKLELADEKRSRREAEIETSVTLW